MRKVLAALPLVLSACASTELLNSTATTVIVKADHKNAVEAQVVADKECGKYGKAAHLSQSVSANKVWANFFFSCE
jgi:hypothetical protein